MDPNSYFTISKRNASPFAVFRQRNENLANSLHPLVPCSARLKALLGAFGRLMSTTTAICQTSLAAELAAARTRTDYLFGVLRPEALYARPIGERHRMIFYVGHLEAFDWNMVCRRGLGLPSFHPEFDRLFEFGIDPAEGNLPADTESDWPSIGEVQLYNRRVRAELDTAIENAPEQIIRMAIEHRWMHAETLAYLLH